MNLLDAFFEQIGRSSPGSEDTSSKVVSLCGKGKTAFYIGSDANTAVKLKEAGYAVTAGIFLDENSQKMEACGIDTMKMEWSELPQEALDADLFWRDGTVELSSLQKRLEYLKANCKKGCTVVLRALSWLIDPSPDTRKYCKARFGEVLSLDEVLRLAKEAGFKIADFYISPKSDWTTNYYTPLQKLAEEYVNSNGDEESLLIGISKLKKEIEVFELHCEEYSYVYYILKG